VVYNVVECLGDIGDRSAVSALMQLLRNPPDEWVHVATLEALGKIGDQRAVDLLLFLVNKEFVADPLINALGSLGDGRAIPTLIGYVKDEDRDIRELAIKALVSVWEEVELIASFTGVGYELDAIRDLLRQSMTSYIKSLVMSEMTGDHIPQEVRENCVVLLSAIDYHKAIPAIVELIEAYPLSTKLITALNRYNKRALNHVLPLLEHADFRVRQSVGLYLQYLVQRLNISTAPVKQGLISLLEDENPILKQLALETLTLLKSSSTIPAFIQVMQSEPAMFGDAVTEALAQFSKRTVSALIQEHFDEADEAILPYYLKMLGYSSPRLDTIKKYFKHPKAAIQEAAILATGFTGNPNAIPLLLPFIMSRQNTQTRCAAAQSLQCIITTLKTALPKPKNIFDALFVMLNTYKTEEELAIVAQALGTLCGYNYDEITPLNVAVVRGRLLDLLAGVTPETQGKILRSLQGIIDMSSFAPIRELRRVPSLDIQKIVASLYARFDKDLRVVADISDMISHSEFSIRKYWILTAGHLCAIELTDLLVPLLADQNFRTEAFQALVMMGTELLPRLKSWLHHEDPRIKKMAAVVAARISQDHIDKFCTIP
jgi:HEAT repeat protein